MEIKSEQFHHVDCWQNIESMEFVQTIEFSIVKSRMTSSVDLSPFFLFSFCIMLKILVYI